MATRRKYDLVVFGSTGFTGQFVVEEIGRTITSERSKDGGPLTWAIAGRDMKKLQDVLTQATIETGVDLSDIPIIIADVKSETSLNEMCRQANLVLNCVGPYRLYGTPVVKACIENGTNHIDICGEPGWLEETELVYGSKAKEAGIFILEACGFDSIPSELGVVYTKQQFQGLLHSVECFIGVKSGKQGGASMNYGTWLSAVYSVANYSELREIRRKLHTTTVPKSQHKLAKRGRAFYSEEARGWCLPFLGADKSIVYRSQVTNYLWKKQQPIQFEPYIRCGGVLNLISLIFGLFMFAVLAHFSLGRYLLENYPRLLSFGVCSKSGPSRKQIADSSARMTFVGLGYDKDQTDESGPPKKKIVTSLTMPEIGYVTTPICMVQAAYAFLGEKEKLPPGGGVFTPGAAFAGTSLLTRLQQRGLKFSVVEQ